jgi:alpha-beta hydrolase superfamily lysophospholipase
MELELVTADDVHLAAHRFPAAGKARASVVVVHGFAATSDESRVIALADALHDAGHDVLAYDSRGHGGSGGETTLGDREQLDVAAAVDTMRDSGAPVVLAGASMGAIGVLRYAVARTDGLAGIVTVSCPSRWRLPLNPRGVVSALLTQTPLGRALAARFMHVRIARGFSRPAPPVDLVPLLHAPLAIVHGRADPFIPPSDAQELYRAAHDPRRLDLVAGLGHAFEPLAVEPVLAAVDWALRSSR